MFSWRSLTFDDVAAVTEIADAVHPDYPEQPLVPSNRVALFGEGCLLCERDGKAVGYMLAHPWRRHDPVPLNHTIDSLPAGADCLYIHDLALLPESRGSGAAQAAVARAGMIAHARNLAHISIVALPAAVSFWERQGFGAVPLDRKAALEDKYGPGAVYMERAV